MELRIRSTFSWGNSLIVKMAFVRSAKHKTASSKATRNGTSERADWQKSGNTCTSHSDRHVDLTTAAPTHHMTSGTDTTICRSPLSRHLAGKNQEVQIFPYFHFLRVRSQFIYRFFRAWSKVHPSATTTERAETLKHGQPLPGKMTSIHLTIQTNPYKQNLVRGSVMPWQGTRFPTSHSGFALVATNRDCRVAESVI